MNIVIFCLLVLYIIQPHDIPTLDIHDLYTIKAAVDLSEQRQALRWCGMGLLRAQLNNKVLTESVGFVLIFTPFFFKIASMVSNDALFTPFFFRPEFEYIS